MARLPIKSIKQKTEVVAKPKHRCRECAHSYDWNNRSFADGHLIFCRCKLDARSLYGKFCKFLSDTECRHFKERPENAPDYAEAN